MSDITRHPQFYLNKNWCNSKCQLDKEFRMPFSSGDPLFLQLDLTDHFSSMRVCGVYGIDLNGTRITPNLKDTLGAAYWKQNTDTNGLNIFTIRVPDIGACTLGTAPDPNCCYVDIYDIGDPHDGTYSYFNLIFNGVSYSLITDSLPSGWHFVNISSTPKRYIYFPCLDVPKGDLLFETQKISGDNHSARIDIKKCPEKFCDCYYLISESLYANIDRVIINGTVYNHDAILVQSPSLIPGISPNTQHTQDILGNWLVPVDCNLNKDGVDFETDISGEWQSVFVEYNEANCESHSINKIIGCFAFEFVLGQNGECDLLHVYSEPYECTDANCEYNDATAIVYSNYGSKAHDVLGIWTFNIADIGDPTLNDGALGNFAAPGLRIPAIVLDLPSKIAITRNAKCFIYKSEAVNRWKLQGRRAYPPYFAKMVESIVLGRDFNYAGRQYQVVGDTIFESIQVPGFSAFKLNAQLESCNQYQYFDCV